MKQTPAKEGSLELSWNNGSRCFSVGERGETPPALDGIGGSVEVDGKSIALVGATDACCRRRELPDGGTSCVAELDFPAVGLTWRWELANAGSEVTIVAALRNTGHRELLIGRWNVIHMQKAWGSRLRAELELGDVRFFRWHPWDMRVELLRAGEGERSSNNICHLYNPARGTTLLCGFITLDRMSCTHVIRYERGRGIEEYRASCTFGTYPLSPGKELISEKLSIRIHADPYQALEAWAETVQKTYRPAFRESPPVGWCGWGWIDAFSDREDCWEKVALDNARAIRDKLPGFDVSYLWTSQYNLKEALPGNWLESEQRQIPSGMKSFCQAQQQLGFTPALWVAPFWFFSEAAGMLRDNSDNLLRDREGQAISEAASWEFDPHPNADGSPRLHKYYVDGTHPKTADFVRKVFAYYRELGVRYYMLDFLEVKESSRLYDPTQTPLQSARSILQVIRDEAGAETHLQTAVSSTPGFIGLIDAARVGRDFGEGRPLFPPFAGWHNATYVLHDPAFGNTRSLVQNAAASYFTHRFLYLNDFNLLTIDKPVPLPHAQIAVTVFGLGGGSPLMLGDDYRTIAAERLRMVKLCLPRTRTVPVPVDLFDNVYPDDSCRIVKLSVKTEWDSYLLVALFNLDEVPFRTDLSFPRLGLSATAPHQVYEFWTEEYRGIFRASFPCDVPSGSCRLYRIAEARAHPWLLSTDMHLQQGAVEVRALHWDDASLTLSGTVSRPIGEVGNLIFLMPRKFRLVNHEGTGLMKETIDMNVVVRKPIPFQNESESFTLTYEALAASTVARKGWLPYTSEQEWLDHVRKHRPPNDTRVIE